MANNKIIHVATAIDANDAVKPMTADFKMSNKKNQFSFTNNM